jgi:hypothetical protein
MHHNLILHTDSERSGAFKVSRLKLIAVVKLLGYIVAGSSFQQNLVLDGVNLPSDFTSSLDYFPTLLAEPNSTFSCFAGNYSPLTLCVIGKKKTDPAT